MALSRPPIRRGLTIIKLLVVLAVLLFLVALLLPAVQRVRQAAARAQSQNNLKQLALACHNAHDTYRAFPPAVGAFQEKTGSLHFFILPFIEQDALYRRANEGPWDNNTWGTPIPTYVDPADPSVPPGYVHRGWLATTNYAANWMVFKEGKTRLQNIPDGSSNTLMFAQRYQLCDGAPTAWGYPSLYTWAPIVAYYSQARFQTDPRTDECDPTRAQGIGGIINIALCDGSVRAVSPAVRDTTWLNLTDPADGNALEDF